METVRDGVVASADALCEEIAARAQETEADRNVPGDLVERLRQARLFRLLQPEPIGGLELDPLTVIDVIERISHADGSTGWSVLINNTSAILGWLDPQAAAELVGPDSDGVGAGSFAPMGKALPDGNDAYTLTGRWPFNSGCLNADWLLEGAFVMDDGALRMRPDGLPDWRFLFFPAASGRVHDTWYVAGLRGTGSHDVEVESLGIAEAFTTFPMLDPPAFDGAVYRLTFWGVLASLLAGFPLGVARRALEEFSALAERKGRATSGAMATLGDVQVEVARATAALESSRAYVEAAIGQALETVERGDEVSIGGRAAMVRSVLHASRQAVDVVDTLFWYAGGGCLYDTHPLQRCMRDIHASCQHVFFSPESWKRNGKMLLGQEFERHLL